MVQDDERAGLDGVRVVSDAGIALVAMLAGRLGIEGLVGRFWRDLPGVANPGRKVMALVLAMLLGADSIDDCDVLRAGRTRRLLVAGCRRPRHSGRFCGRLLLGMCAGRSRPRLVPKAISGSPTMGPARSARSLHRARSPNTPSHR